MYTQGRYRVLCTPTQKKERQDWRKRGTSGRNHVRTRDTLVMYAGACSLHLINKFFDRRLRTPFAGTLSRFARTFLHAHLEA